MQAAAKHLALFIAKHSRSARIPACYAAPAVSAYDSGIQCAIYDLAPLLCGNFHSASITLAPLPSVRNFESGKIQGASRPERRLIGMIKPPR
jgi:hypothetical protein